MITPIRALSINDICKREDDLLVSKDDIKKLAKNERNKAIDDFMDRLSTISVVTYNNCKEIAEELKVGVKNE